LSSCCFWQEYRNQKVSAGDLPVGLFPNVRYQGLQIALPTGAAILLYTDGVTDALNSRGDEFGEERLISCCASLPKEANAEIIYQLLSNTLAEWSAGVEQFDDITILVLAVE
jgi:serine phosphatase RsbU (regulator of sigma subunit)